VWIDALRWGVLPNIETTSGDLKFRTLCSYAMRFCKVHIGAVWIDALRWGVLPSDWEDILRLDVPHPYWDSVD
jgi:hypothetical protein